MDWFWYALLSAVSFTGFSITIRKFLTNGADARIFTFLNNITTGFVLLLFIPFFKIDFSLQLYDSILLIVASMLFSFSSMLFIVGRQKEEVAIVSVIRQTSVFWILFGSIIFFNETLSLIKVVGIILLFSGTLLVLNIKKNFTLTKGMVMILVGTITLSINSLLSNHLLDSYSPTLYSAVSFLLAGVWQFPFLSKKSERIMKEIKHQKYNLLIVSFFLAMSIFLLYSGYQVGDVSKVFPVYSIYVVLSVIAGMIFLGENTNIRYKILGSLIALGGIILLRYF